MEGGARPPALCTPTSLFSLCLSTTSTTDSNTDAPIAKTYATAESISAKQETPEPASRLRSARMWPDTPGRHLSSSPVFCAARPPAWRSPVRDFSFYFSSNINSSYLLLVLLWLQSIVVLFRLYSIFLSHFKPFILVSSSSFFMTSMTLTCVLITSGCFSARLRLPV